MEQFFALLAAVLIFGLIIFQFLLAGGAPLGRFAWGGQHLILPTKLRVASALVSLVYIFFALVILQEAGLISWLPENLSSNAIWPITIYLFIGIIMNAASRSKLEKYVMTPLAAELFISFLIVAT